MAPLPSGAVRLVVENGVTRHEHRVLDAGGRPCGALRMPAHRFGTGDTVLDDDAEGDPRRPEIAVGADRYRIETDVVRTRRIGPSDLRFSLLRGGADRRCETARVEVRPKRRVRRLSVPAGRFDLVQRHNWFRLCFMVRSAGGSDDVGTIVETTRFLGRRTFEIEMPSAIDTPAQIFAFFVALKGTHR